MDWDAYVADGLLADQAHSATPIANGLIKDTYRVATSDGSHILQTVDRNEEWRLHKQRHTYEHATRAGIPAPTIVHDASDDPVPYQVTTDVPGTDLAPFHELSVAEQHAYAGHAGHTLARLHDAFAFADPGFVSGNTDGLFVYDPADDWEAYLGQRTERWLDRIRDAAFSPELVDELDAAASTALETVPRNVPYTLCHDDYGPGNLLGADGRLTAVIDWDNAFSGDAWYDYVAAERTFHDMAGDEHSDTVRDAFRRGYDHVRALPSDSLHAAYDVLTEVQRAGIVAWLVDHKHEEPGLIDRYEDRLQDEMMDW